MYINICFLGSSVMYEAKTNLDEAGALSDVIIFYLLWELTGLCKDDSIGPSLTCVHHTSPKAS